MTPFFGPVKATVTGTPGSGAITPSTASAGYLAFSAIPSNLMLFCRADDASNAWMTFYTLWNGTTLSAPVFVDSSSGSQLSLTSAAVISVVPDPNRVQPHIGSGKWAMANAIAAGSTFTLTGASSATATASATAAAATYATTNYLTRQMRVKYTSATTASAQAGFSLSFVSFSRSDTAFMGGFNFVARWGCSQLPTSPRLALGVSAGNLSTPTEASGVLNTAIFGKDSTDTNIQFMSNNGSGSATKVDTGIALVANAFYETSVWCAPGSATLYYYICRLDTGAGFLGSATSKVPVADSLMNVYVTSGLNATNTGTAVIMEIQSVFIQTSF